MAVVVNGSHGLLVECPCGGVSDYFTDTRGLSGSHVQLESLPCGTEIHGICTDCCRESLLTKGNGKKILLVGWKLEQGAIHDIAKIIATAEDWTYDISVQVS